MSIYNSTKRRAKVIGEIPPEYKERQDLYNEYFDFIHDNYQGRAYLTVQFCKEMSIEQSQRMLNKLLGMTSTKMYGNNYTRRGRNNLIGYCVTEKNKLSIERPDNIHFHMVLDDLKKTEDFYHAFKREFNESVRRTCKNYSIKGEKPPVAPSSVCIKEVTDTHNLLDYNLKTIKKDIYKTDNINFIHKGKLKFY